MEDDGDGQEVKMSDVGYDVEKGDFIRLIE